MPLSARATTAAVGTGPAFMTQLQGAMAPAALAPTGGVATTGSANAMARVAETQVGQSEQPPGSNESPAIATYRSATAGAVPGDGWCAYFVSWVARQAGTPLGDQGQGFGYVGDIWSWAQSHGRAIQNGPGVVPKPGDLIVFGDQHVGIVDKVLPNGSIQTIEGNYSNQVSRVVRGAGEATGYVQMG